MWWATGSTESLTNKFWENGGGTDEKGHKGSMLFELYAGSDEWNVEAEYTSDKFSWQLEGKFNFNVQLSA